VVFLGNWRTEREAAETYDRAVLFFGADKVRLDFRNQGLRASAAVGLTRRPGDFSAAC
jgi:hypothetical protein